MQPLVSTCSKGGMPDKQPFSMCSRIFRGALLVFLSITGTPLHLISAHFFLNLSRFLAMVVASGVHFIRTSPKSDGFRETIPHSFGIPSEERSKSVGQHETNRVSLGRLVILKKTCLSICSNCH